MIKNYTTIFIDMYGVILKESKGNFAPYTYKNFPESEHERIKKLFDEEKLFIKAQLGAVSSEEFLKKLGFDNPENAVKDYIENNLTLDEGFIAFAEKVKEKYDLVLISNDIAEWSDYITRFFGIEKYFKSKFISSDIQSRKPDFKIFDTALEKLGLSAAECIFVDNRAKNLVAAEEVGLSPILFDRDGEHYYGASVSSFAELLSLIG